MNTHSLCYCLCLMAINTSVFFDCSKQASFPRNKLIVSLQDRETPSLVVVPSFHCHLEDLQASMEGKVVFQVLGKLQLKRPTSSLNKASI